MPLIPARVVFPEAGSMFKERGLRDGCTMQEYNGRGECFLCIKGIILVTNKSPLLCTTCATYMYFYFCFFKHIEKFAILLMPSAVRISC